MSRNVLTVARHGHKAWSVSADDEVLIVTRTKRDATHLANAAAKTLRQSGGEAAVKVAEEPRSFTD